MEGAVKTAEYLYIWDGLKLCEKRDSAVESFPVVIYYPQGERKFLSGAYINYFYLRDRLGSVRGTTSDTGSIIQNLDYLPYGPPFPQQPASPDPDFGFTGHRKCPFTSLVIEEGRPLFGLVEYERSSYPKFFKRRPPELLTGGRFLSALEFPEMRIARTCARARQRQTHGLPNAWPWATPREYATSSVKTCRL